MGIVSILVKPSAKSEVSVVPATSARTYTYPSVAAVTVTVSARAVCKYGLPIRYEGMLSPKVYVRFVKILSPTSTV